jgi:hypothetical protein
MCVTTPRAAYVCDHEPTYVCDHPSYTRMCVTTLRMYVTNLHMCVMYVCDLSRGRSTPPAAQRGVFLH